MSKEETVASLLRELRRREGRTLRSAASELGVAPSQLSRMERGERSVGGDTVERLSQYYKVSAETIALASGQIPSDVVTILRAHPEEIERLRRMYGDD